jgi:integrase
MTDNITKKIQREIVNAFNDNLVLLTKPKTLKKITQEIEEKNDSKTGVDFILVKATKSHKLFSKSKTFRIALTKYIQYVYESEFSKAKDLMMSFKPIVKLIDMLYPSTKTKQGIYGSFRKILSSRFGEFSKIHKDSKKDLSISFEQYKAVEKQQREKVVERNNEKKQFDREKILEIIQTLVNSTDFIDSIVLVGMCTGSRLIEILRISEYQKVVGNPNRVLIQSLAKGSGEAKERNLNKQVERPILVITYKELSATVKVVRDAVKEQTMGQNLDNRALSAKYNARVNRRIKKLGISGGTAYDLRKIYANLSYELIADQTKITKNAWIMKILSHEDLQTSLHYNNIALTSTGQSIDAHLDDLEAKQEQVEKRVEQVETKYETKYPSSTDPNAVKFIVGVNEVYISRVPRIKDGKENKLKRGKAKIEEMKEKGVPITNFNLRKLGFGAEIVAELMLGIN